jgi:hypothetical protein
MCRGKYLLLIVQIYFKVGENLKRICLWNANFNQILIPLPKRQIRIDNRYDEQLGDVLQILLAFYFLSLGDFGISPRLCKTI